jgi:hypothetical protein
MIETILERNQLSQINEIIGSEGIYALWRYFQRGYQGLTYSLQKSASNEFKVGSRQDILRSKGQDRADTSYIEL